MKKNLICLFLLITLLYSPIAQGSLIYNEIGSETLGKQQSKGSYFEDTNDKVDSHNINYSLNMADLVDPFISHSKDIRGVYINAWTAGNRTRMNNLLDEIERSDINAMVIDLKDTDGIITFMEQEGRRGMIIRNLKDIIDRAQEKGIYVIARLAVFNDSIFAQNNPEHALEFLSTKDNKTIIKSKNWASPYSKKVWDYNLDIVKKAARLGVDEIKFDYIRFPTLALNSTLLIKEKDYTKSEIIVKFIEYANKELEEYNVLISADVFGLTTTIPGDLNIGQDITKIVHHVDYISPMVYPSHYDSGMYGISNPDANPYPIIYRSLRDAKRMLGEDSHKLRPWLQSFSIGHKYGEKEIADQIRAIKELDMTGWLLWNPRSVYNFSFLQEDKRRDDYKWNLQGSELFPRR